MTEILERAKGTISGFEEEFEQALRASSQAVIFGSFACNCENPDSDIDVLFVGPRKRVRNRRLDFIWISRSKPQSRIWLGSELANHIARYGIWIKGDDDWRVKVFVSQEAIQGKKRRIYFRLVHLLLKRDKLRGRTTRNLFQKVLLDCRRLTLLKEGVPIPPTPILKSLLREDESNLMDEMSREDFLGQVGREFFKQIFRVEDFHTIYAELKEELQVK